MCIYGNVRINIFFAKVNKITNSFLIRGYANKNVVFTKEVPSDAKVATNRRLVKKTHKDPYKYIDMIFELLLRTQTSIIIPESATIIYDYDVQRHYTSFKAAGSNRLWWLRSKCMILNSASYN